MSLQDELRKLGDRYVLQSDIRKGDELIHALDDKLIEQLLALFSDYAKRKNDEKIERLQKTLAPVIDWYVKIETEGELDGSYLYDTTYEIFNDNLGRGDFQEIIEILKPTPPSESEKHA